MRRASHFFWLISAVITSLIVFPGLALASFNANKIITDDDLTDYSRMSVNGIQNFLTTQGGILSSYQTTDVDGVNKSAAAIIYNAAYRYRLNPQFLLATLQKESSLVTGSNTSLLDWAMGFAVCDGCSKSDPSVIAYAGFAKQMDAAGNRIRNSYLANLEDHNSTISGWGVGVSKTTLDGVSITPLNQATAVLYTYTPWVGYYGGDSSVGGNSLFYDIMERFFPNRSSLQLDYPNLSLLQDQISGSVYKLEDDALRPITSSTALLANYDPSRIIPVESDVINRYDLGDPIVVPKFILVQAPTGGIYLIDGEHKKRAITSREVFHNLGFNPEEVIPISAETLASIPDDPPITHQDQYPIGGLLQNSSTGAVSYLDTSGRLHPIWSKVIIDNRFKGYPLYATKPADLAHYKSGAPEKLNDGTLVKISGRDTIYVIDHGQKRRIPSDTILNKLGGYKDVVTIPKSVLKLHDAGATMKLTKVKNQSTTDS